MEASLTQVVAISAAFFAAVAGIGIWLGISSRRPNASESHDGSLTDPAAASLQRFDSDLNDRMRDLDAHLAQAHAEIDRHVASVR